MSERQRPKSRGALDIVVIGAGVGGLAVAARMGAAGHRVTVLEQAPVVGGKLGWKELDVPGLGRFGFDTGPSLVTLPAVFEETFEATGSRMVDELELLRLDPVARYRFADGSLFDAAADTEALLDNAEALARGNADDLRAFFRRAEDIWRLTKGSFLERPLRGPLTLATYARDIRALRSIAPWATLRSLANHYLRDPRLVQFVDRYATYAGSDPRRVPAALASIPWVEHAFGGWYVVGGLRRVGDALAASALRNGADIRCSVDVEQVVVAHGRAVGVMTSAGAVKADIVIANVDAAHLYGQLLAPAPAGLRRTVRRVARTEASLSGLVICLAVEGKTAGLAHHNVLFPARYDEEFDDLFGTRTDDPRPVREPTIYFSIPPDPAIAPSGSEAWFVLVNAPAHRRSRSGVDWDQEGRAEAEADRVLALLARRGIDLEGRVRSRIVRSPATLAVETRAAGGSIYGTSSNGAMAAFLRPANESPLPGLFLVGGSSHPGGGLPLVLLSARIVAEMIGPA